MSNRVLDLNTYFNVVKTDSPFLYSDVAGFSPNSINPVTPSYNYDAVKQSIRNILDFRLGERPLNPNFGNTLHRFVYEPNTQETITRLINAVKELFTRWDSRIVIHNIDAYSTDEMKDSHQLIVNVTYYIKGLDSALSTYSFSIG